MLTAKVMDGMTAVGSAKKGRAERVKKYYFELKRIKVTFIWRIRRAKRDRRDWCIDGLRE